MVTATPETFLAVLKQVFDDALKAAEGAPQDFNDILDRVVHDAGEQVDQIKKLPQDVYDDLKKLLDPPDWWSLLAFLVLKVSELDPDLSVGTFTPTGWVRMITLTYTPGVEAAAFTLGLGLVKDPVDPARQRGLLLRAGVGPEQGFTSGRFSFKVTSTGAGDWSIPFGGSIGPPVAAAKLTIDASLDFWPEPAGQPPASLVPGDVADLWIGPLALHTTLSAGAGEPLYDLKLSVGTSGSAGIHAGLARPEPLKGFPFSINLPTIEYTPTATLTQNESPGFALNPGGGA